MKKLARITLIFFVISTLLGCLSPIALNRAVELYDQAAIRSESRQLLTNIARAQHHEPLHFTRVSNIAATFNFSANAGATPALTGESGGLLAPIFGGGVSENPTFSTDPIASEEFTKRLLTPFSQHKLTLLLRQHFDIDLLLRMMAQEVYLHHNEQQHAAHDTRAHEMRGLQHRLHRGAKTFSDSATLDFAEQTKADELPDVINLSVQSHGKYYAVNTTEANAHWNLNAFQLLYILYRLTVTDAKSLGLPITIAK